MSLYRTVELFKFKAFQCRLIIRLCFKVEYWVCLLLFTFRDHEQKLSGVRDFIFKISAISVIREKSNNYRPDEAGFDARFEFIDWSHNNRA